jgi:hypothetical protein
MVPGVPASPGKTRGKQQECQDKDRALVPQDEESWKTGQKRWKNGPLLSTAVKELLATYLIHKSSAGRCFNKSNSVDGFEQLPCQKQGSETNSLGTNEIARFLVEAWSPAVGNLPPAGPNRTPLDQVRTRSVHFARRHSSGGVCT